MDDECLAKIAELETAALPASLAEIKLLAIIAQLLVRIEEKLGAQPVTPAPKTKAKSKK